MSWREKRSNLFILGVATGASVWCFIDEQYKKYLKRYEDCQKENSAERFGLPNVPNLTSSKHLVTCFDTRTKNPSWVLEHIRKDQPKIVTRDNSEFKEDLSLPARFRSKLSDYKGSGYDRGHMAPAANHKTSKEDMDNSFVLSNVSPQVGNGFNRDYWARFESFSKSLTYTCDDVYIVTGPLYLPSKTGSGFTLKHDLIGEPPSLVSVPTHFYKVVLGTSGVSTDVKATVGAFVMPNAPIDPETPLASFVVPLESLESVSGLQFFPKLLDVKRREIVDESALTWQVRGYAARVEQESLKKTDYLNPLRFIKAVGQEEISSKHAFATPTAINGSIDDVILANYLPVKLHDSDLMTRQSEAVTKVIKERKQKKVPSIKSNSDTSLIADVHLSKRDGLPNNVLHICDHTRCRLPAPDWYLKNCKEDKATLSKTQL